MIQPAPDVSVIVPVRNGERSLPALLRSLEAQTFPRGRFEVLIVDNDSSDRTTEVAAEHGVRVVHEPVRSRSRARNRGARAAGSRLFAFTDVDCVADPGWLGALVAAGHRAPLVAGEVRLVTSPTPNAIERFEALWRFGQAAWVEQGWAAAANLLVHADAFEAIGGFDPAYRHFGEDADFCLRAGSAGYGIAYCAEAIVEHRGERDVTRFARRCFMHGYGASQALHRVGVGARAWRAPLPALTGDRALRQFGHMPARFDEREWRRMARLARLGYAARIAGSVWAEVRRAR